MGRRMFDGGETSWGDTPPFRAPVFVLTHRPRATLQREGGTSFTFVTGGIEHLAPVVPDRRGDLHVLPRLLGDGTRLYDVADGSVRKLQDLGRR
jgi:dihydrofolate reductase